MSKKIQAIYETNPDVPNSVASYLHCAKCLDEMPKGISPKDYQHVQFGITKDGNWQLWCVWHNCNVAVITLKLP